MSNHQSIFKTVYEITRHKMGGILQNDAKKYSDIYINMLEKPGIPFVDMTLKGLLFRINLKKASFKMPWS